MVYRFLSHQPCFNRFPDPAGTLHHAPSGSTGVVGSLAHHDTVATAAIAGTKKIAALGIDIEPNEPLPENLIALIDTPSERRMYDLHTLKRRDLFVLKEAVYKACFPMDRQFLEFQDVEIDIFARSGHVSKANRTFSLELLISKNVIGVAYSRPNEVEEPLEGQHSLP
ncbi:4'-phosphopantetheinyl transferase superfamily protein [Bradyrhizobium sp. USDA 3364]